MLASTCVVTGTIGRTLAAAGLALGLSGCGGAPVPDTSQTTSAPAPAAVPAAPSGPRLAVRVTFDGAVPAPAMVRLDAYPECVAENGGTERPTEAFVVGDQKALRHVFVYVSAGVEGVAAPPPDTPVVLDQDRCRYEPRVLGVRVGQALEIRNSDALLHNIRAHSAKGQAFNVGQPVEGMRSTRRFTSPEVMVPVRCDVHTWMQAWIGVVDHPFFGVTGADGVAQLPALPPGSYTVTAWHEVLGTQSATVTVAADAAQPPVAIAFARRG
jgi:hypothetical protein